MNDHADPYVPSSSSHPRPFEFDDATSRTLPILGEADTADLTAVLRSLARGTYPRLDAVTTALNAYNLTPDDDDDNNNNSKSKRKAWAYFHAVTEVPAAGAPLKEPPEIMLDPGVLEDTERPWHSMRPGGTVATGGLDVEESAYYRFVCFIHKHRVDRKKPGQKVVYTITIWDRELDWVTWHDMYDHERDARRKDVRRFWEIVRVPDCWFMKRRSEFLAKMRWRMTYHICERLEASMRDVIAPRHTLWAVMAIGLHHMNRGSEERHVDLVPDELETFGGTDRELLPTLFVRLLLLCLRATWQGTTEQAWDSRNDEGARKFVEQFAIVARMTWMKAHVRKILEGYTKERTGAWLNGLTWLYPALRID